MTKLIEIITYGDDCVLHGACIDGMPMVRADELCELIKPWAKREHDENQLWREIAPIEGYQYRIIPKVELWLDEPGTVFFVGYKEAVDMVMKSVVDCSNRGEAWTSVLSEAIKESHNIKESIQSYSKRALRGEYTNVDMMGRRRRRWKDSKLCRLIWGIKNGAGINETHAVEEHPQNTKEVPRRQGDK